MLDNKISRRSFLKGTAAAVAAIPFIKAERLMNVWTPPEPEIFTGYGEPKIITDPLAFNFTINGLVPGCQVMLKNEITGEVLINEVVRSRSARWNVPENMGGAPVNVYVRKPEYKAFMTRVGAPYPGGKTSIRGIQLTRDLVVA